MISFILQVKVLHADLLLHLSMTGFALDIYERDHPLFVQNIISASSKIILWTLENISLFFESK